MAKNRTTTLPGGGSHEILLLFSRRKSVPLFGAALFVLLSLVLSGAPAPIKLGPLSWLSVRPASAQVDTFTQSRPFQGPVRRDIAERLARAAAENSAMQQAMRLLAQEPDLHFAGAASNAAGLPPLEGMARMLFSTRTTTVGVQGFPPNMQAMVEVRLEAPADMRKALHGALLRPDVLEYYAQVMEQQALLVAECDVLALELLPLNPNNAGKEGLIALQHRIRELDALELFLEILPQFGRSLQNPEEVHRKLRKALDLAPRDGLLLTADAEVLLQLDRPAEALETANRAVRFLPAFARAYDIQGAILLRFGLPSLAADSFSRAIALAPKNPVYLAHRASAYLVLEESSGMCADFQAACGLGDCEGYQWARDKGHCPPGEPQRQSHEGQPADRQAEPPAETSGRADSEASQP